MQAPRAQVSMRGVIEQLEDLRSRLAGLDSLSNSIALRTCGHYHERNEPDYGRAEKALVAPVPQSSIDEATQVIAGVRASADRVHEALQALDQRL